MYFRARLPGVKQTGTDWRTQCPVHNGERESFAISAESGQSFCHSACRRGWNILSLEQELAGSDFLTAKAEVFDIVGRAEEARKVPFADRIEKLYDYTDEDGEVIYQIVRLRDPKDFRQRHPDGRDGWIWKKGARQVLYRLHQLKGAPIVYVVEGEKDADTLISHGFIATTNAGGADAPWLSEYTDALRHCERVVLIPDSDDKGRRRIMRIARALAPVVPVKVIELESKDVTEWFSAGHSESELRMVAE